MFIDIYPINGSADPFICWLIAAYAHDCMQEDKNLLQIPFVNK